VGNGKFLYTEGKGFIGSSNRLIARGGYGGDGRSLITAGEVNVRAVDGQGNDGDAFLQQFAPAHRKADLFDRGRFDTVGFTFKAGLTELDGDGGQQTPAQVAVDMQFNTLLARGVFQLRPVAVGVYSQQYIGQNGCDSENNHHRHGQDGYDCFVRGVFP